MVNVAVWGLFVESKARFQSFALPYASSVEVDTGSMNTVPDPWGHPIPCPGPEYSSLRAAAEPQPSTGPKGAIDLAVSITASGGTVIH